MLFDRLNTIKIFVMALLVCRIERKNAFAGILSEQM